MNNFVLFITLMAMTSCYRMPTDEDYCVVPTINNRDITREKPLPQMPGVQY